jgi:cell division inhibitor SulA/protein ImuA
MDESLESLLQQGHIWKATQETGATVPVIPSGFAELDARLPGGGWPRGALTELLLEQHGLGELALLLPALVQLCQCGERERAPRWVCWVAPPFMPYAPALAAHGLPPERMLVVHPQRGTRARIEERLWAAEQALHSGQCCAVLVWANQMAMADQRLRRLQLAAESSGAWAIVFRHSSAAALPSPAALRLQLCAEGLTILKCRGGGRSGRFSLSLRPPGHAE